MKTEESMYEECVTKDARTFSTFITNQKVTEVQKMSKKCSHDPVIFWVISEWARVRGLVLVKYFALLIQTQEAFSKEPLFFSCE